MTRASPSRGRGPCRGQKHAAYRNLFPPLPPSSDPRSENHPPLANSGNAPANPLPAFVTELQNWISRDGAWRHHQGDGAQGVLVSAGDDDAEGEDVGDSPPCQRGRRRERVASRGGGEGGLHLFGLERHDAHRESIFTLVTALALVTPLTRWPLALSFDCPADEPGSTRRWQTRCARISRTSATPQALTLMAGRPKPP